ncbi:hypothetical protein P152DRAFT_434517 [Eremomyces bilateralis CBS 781.70]|uniref:UBC core domain-containing protein n=1 Tax=Eremomyces bilateralis CBS 781.70 TaxID=1392243 RepID=A0A6G1G6G7_9PEZI|nr:uncharacterized protein P152DRAFT_434517 [Eremomyces bilateralis CBS 781.70]KAF1813429.1 hypothetical protein P152DRAFT_434517 [Eremomyces bilateralis CBS 781.70]
MAHNTRYKSTVFVEDLVRIPADPRSLGQVESTHTEIDSHQPHPLRHGEEITRHSSVSSDDLNEFFRSGIPPPETVLVHWHLCSSDDLSLGFMLMKEPGLEVVDRLHVLTDPVLRDVNDQMAGVILGKRSTASLAPVASEVNGTIQFLQHREGPIDLTQSNVLHGIPAEELVIAEDYKPKNIVLYKGWVGRIVDMYETVYVGLSDGSVVEPKDLDSVQHVHPALHSDETTVFQVGDHVQTKKHNLRLGTWVFGAYNPNIEPKGFVYKVQTKALLVDWHRSSKDMSQSSVQAPPEELDSELVVNGDAIIYDPSRLPSSVSGSEFRSEKDDLPYGTFVRFRDLPAASAKYSDPDDLVSPGKKRGVLQKVSREAAKGFDLNCFEIIETQTECTVLWQDNTVTREPAKSLIPQRHLLDMAVYAPGDVVMTRELLGGEEDWIKKPAKVGLLQSVNSAQRTAMVRWFSEVDVRYMEYESKEHGVAEKQSTLLPNPQLGPLNPQAEEITIYDIDGMDALMRHPGDFVCIESRMGGGGGQKRHPKDWFGEVVNLGLEDGLVSVRLSALEEVVDVKVPLDDTTIVFGLEDRFSEFDEESDDDDLMSQPISDDLSDQSELAWPSLLGSRREILEELDHSMDSDGWETEDESFDGDDDEGIVSSTDDNPDPDTSMTDADGQLPETPAVDYATTEPALSADLPSTTDIPPLPGADQPSPIPQFDIIDGPLRDHAFQSEPPTINSTFLRRVKKENDILRKSLPPGIYIRSSSSRLDFYRALIIGPPGTPYEQAPFMVDLYLQPDFPTLPPKAFFHSWNTKGEGAINPNLYEDGTICLSLLGTWTSGSNTESWNGAKSTILQLLVSIQALILVREPYFNEAGYEARVNLEDSVHPSRYYSERTYFRSRDFISYALEYDMREFGDIIHWLYLSRTDGAPRLLDVAINDAKRVLKDCGPEPNAALSNGSTESSPKLALDVLTNGARTILERKVAALEKLRDTKA